MYVLSWCPLVKTQFRLQPYCVYDLERSEGKNQCQEQQRNINTHINHNRGQKMLEISMNKIGCNTKICSPILA